MDKLREDARERTWADYLETAGAALAIGAGAVYFLRGNASSLSRLGQQLAGARNAWARGAFENGLQAGRSEAYKIAMDVPIKTDFVKEAGLEAFAVGDDILKGGNQSRYMERMLRNDFKGRYGRALLDRMMASGENHYLNENAELAIKNMFSDFMKTDESLSMSEAGMRYYLRNSLGDKAPEETIEEAIRFASEIKRQLQDKTFLNSIDNIKSDWSVDVGEFVGFNLQNGVGIWDMTKNTATLSEVNPSAQIQRIAQQARNILDAKRYNEEINQSGFFKNIIDTALGERVTIKEALEAVDRGELDRSIFGSRLYLPGNGSKDRQFPNTLDIIRDWRNSLSGTDRDVMDSLVVGSLRRDAEGKIYSTAGLSTIKGYAEEAFAETLPGKMLRTTEELFNRAKPDFHVFSEGTSDLFLSDALGGAAKNFETNRLAVYMNGRFWTDNGTKLEEIESLRDFTLLSTRVGSARDFIKGMREDARHQRAVSGMGWKERILKGLDVRPEISHLEERYGNNLDWMLHADFTEYGERIARLGTKEGTEDIQRVERFLKNMDRYSAADMHAEDLKILRDIMNQTVNPNGMASTAMQQAINILEDETGQKAIEYLSSFRSISNAKNIENTGLVNLIGDFLKDPNRTMLQKMTHADLAKNMAGSVHFTSDTYRINTARELVKEAMLQTNLADEERATAIVWSGIGQAFKDSLEKRQRYRTLASVAFMDKQTRRHMYDQRIEKKAQKVLEFFQELRVDAAGHNRSAKLLNAFEEFNERYNLDGGWFKHAERVGYDQTGQAWERQNMWTVMPKKYEWGKQIRIAAGLVANSNQQTFTKAAGQAFREITKPLTQYIAGYGDMFGSVSVASAKGYRIFNLVDQQLNHEFDFLGRHIKLRFGLNEHDKGSAAQIYRNLLLKRVLPVAALYTYADFTDDAVRAMTGMGLGEAGMSGLANIDLAVRKVTGATYLDYVLKSVTSDSPIARYYAGVTGDISPEWQSYEERKDYYERGYTPIRKARYWKFGSSNEYRGGRVSYFEPNTLRMMRSNYFMESMYEGSMWTKWSHSLLPTPLNPASTLFYMLDPYYLERLHKEDRPYPITGSTFAENTPWGIALNPFFDLIKPRKQMHRDRLGEDGVDVKALIEHINNQIKQRSNNQQNGDIIYLQNGKLRSMLFTAFNAPTPSERIVSSQGAEVTMSTEYGEYGSGIDANEYPALAAANIGRVQEAAAGGIGLPGFAAPGEVQQAERLSVSDRLVISAGKGNVFASVLVNRMKESGLFDTLRGANAKIREKGMLRKDQGLFYENKMQYEKSSLEDMLSNSETIADLMTAGKGHDYVHEMAVSTRMIAGLYGYMASVVTGVGSNNQKQIATSANMESAGRTFWDLSIGGFGGGPFGGEIMEIARRFIPEFHRMQQVNPLMNTMPDWLPERMRFGDPYTAIPKGEARLPGRGYESLNPLHPDIFGRYGAFDRFKILADVAPYSPEYKFWKKVATSTIQDPKLKQEIQEIKDRVAEQTKGHDFYEYKYIGRGMQQQTAIVSEVMNFGKFKIIGSDQVFKLSGVKISGNPNETTQQVLSRYLVPGQEISMFTDENPYYARNTDKDRTINAGVIIAGENIAEQMLEAGDAKKRKGDSSAPSYMLRHGPIVNWLNTAQELIGHANIPIIHSRWLNINSPLESYLDDNVYGTSFQNWNFVWGTYIRPSLQIEASSPMGLGIGILGTIFGKNIKGNTQLGRNLIQRELEQFGIMSDRMVSAGKQKWLSRAGRLLDRGSLIGGLGTGIMFMGSSNRLTKAELGADIGHVAGVAYAAMANPDNLAVSLISWSRLGYLAANELLKKEQNINVLRKGLGKGTAIGALIGLTRWAYAQKLLASDDTANTYIPDETRKKWDMQEYFDRLTYIKYMGLYEQAANMAEKEEGINIRQILKAQEKERKELADQKEKLKKDLRELETRHDAEAEEAKKLARKHLSATTGVKVGLRGGQYTKSAIMYKNAADATMYGLDEHALMADIVRALPKTERDYFIEFMNEKDPEKREEILKTVSPMLNRALRTIWKMPLPEKVSNYEYFKHHTLPAPTWAGWRPDIDLANVEAKVVYNEGMQYSDMGIYASQYRDPNVINAPNIEYDTSQNTSFVTQLKLMLAMQGTFLKADSVSVEPAQDSGIQVVANIAQVIPYKISEQVSSLLSF